MFLTENRIELTHSPAKAKLLSVLSAAVLTLGLNACNEQNEASSQKEPAVIVSSTGVTVSPDISVQDRVSFSRVSKGFLPYKVTLSEDASEPFRSEYVQNPCLAVLEDYLGEIACKEKTNSILIASLPGE